MVFAYKAGLVTVGLHVLGQRGLALIEAGKFVDAVDVRVFAGPDNGPTGRADGVGDEGVGKAHAFAGETVEVGRWGDFCEASAVCADGVGGVVVRHDEEDVGPVFARGEKQAIANCKLQNDKCKGEGESRG